MRRLKRLIAGSLVYVMTLVLHAGPASAQAGPGNVSEGLKVWLRASSGISAFNGNPVLTWLDASSNGNNAVFNASNIFGEQPPIYNASNPGVLGQPTVHFANQNALELDLTWLAGSDYTIFVVNSRDRFGFANFYIAGDTFGANRNLVLGYEQVGLLRQAHFSNDLDALVAPYVGTPIWSMDTFRFAQAEGRDIYHDGTHVATDNNSIPLASNTGSTLGHFRTYGNFFWFQGDLAEVVVYNRALTSDERLRVEAELAGRYGRPLRLEDYVPCEGGWQNHGGFVSARARAVEVFVGAGVMTAAEGEEAQSTAAKSGCGQ